MEAGIAANNADERKCRKYAALAEAHQFEPIAVETMGVYGESTGVIIKAIGRRLIETTGDPREANWFRQNLAIVDIELHIHIFIYSIYSYRTTLFYMKIEYICNVIGTFIQVCILHTRFFFFLA